MKVTPSSLVLCSLILAGNCVGQTVLTASPKTFVSFPLTATVANPSQGSLIKHAAAYVQFY